MNEKKTMYSIATIILVIDQVLKIVLSKTISLKGKVTIIPNFFSLYYLKNTGAAFSIFQNQQLFLIIISVIVLLIINHILKKETLTKKTSVYYGLLIGGIYGNLLDRIIRKGVIDYLSFSFFKYDFPVFNFADSMIVIGIILIGINELLKVERK